MTLSGYTWSSNSKAKLYPYEAVLKCLVALCDEVVIVYDPRHDDPNEFLFSPKIKVVEYPFIIEDATGNGKQLSKAREACTGDWVLWLDLDEILHEQDYICIHNLIEVAEMGNFTSILLSMFNIANQFYTWGDYRQWGCRAKLTKNIEGVYHGAVSTRIDDNGHIRMTVGDGVDNMLNGVGCAFREMQHKDWLILNRLHQKQCSPRDVIESLIDYPYIYHYARYSMARKLTMGTHDRNRFFFGGEDVPFDPEQWNKELAQPATIDTDNELYLYDHNMIGPIDIPHPKLMEGWIKMVDTALEG